MAARGKHLVHSHAHEEEIPGTVNLAAVGKRSRRPHSRRESNTMQREMIQAMAKHSFLSQLRIQMILFRCVDQKVVVEGYELTSSSGHLSRRP